MELHLISRECASFVWENVVDHSKVLNYAHILDGNASANLCVDHAPI